MKTSKSIKPKKQLTKAQRRVVIIKDAIQQLEAEAYLTGSYGYLKLSKSLVKLQKQSPNGSAQYALGNLTSKEPCGVCAKGALLLSTVRKENEFDLDQLVDQHATVLARLTEDGLFDEVNLFLMECYYEGWSVVSYGSGVFSVASLPSGLTLQEFKDHHNNKVIEYRNKYADKKERLLVILNNMAKHGGVFKP